MNILIFHGYLLKGTGSNIYNANLSRALVAMGHDVHLLCQERDPESIEHVADVVDVASDQVSRTHVRDTDYPGRCVVYRPEIAGLLPVYVLDEYPGFKVKTFSQLTEAELARYIELNVEAVRQVLDLASVDLALANHEVMGPAILARALGGQVPYSVKAHGSALEYTVADHKERFLPYMEEGMQQAEAVLVGSQHIAKRLYQVMGNRSLEEKISLGPPGVDIEKFRPAPPVEAMTTLNETLNALGLQPVDADEQVVVFVGKFIVSKGVDLLLAAWPLVLVRFPKARLLLVGFGEFEQGLRRLLRAISDGDTATLERVIGAGRQLEGGGQPGRLNYLDHFVASMSEDELADYLRCAKDCGEQVTFVGRLDHDQLSTVLPACEVMVVPSTFPEAFGMVAAEAAACGVVPIVAQHSGLAEVAAVLEEDTPTLQSGIGVDLSEQMVPEIADKVTSFLARPEQERQEIANAVRATAVSRWSWSGVAQHFLEVTGPAV